MKWIFSLLLATNLVDPLYLETLYSKQDPLSLSKQLSFYVQYPKTLEGQKAKKQIEKLLNQEISEELLSFDVSQKVLNDLIAISYKINPAPIKLDAKTKQFINALTQDFENKKLKGHTFCSLDELKNAQAQDIDVSRGLLILSAFEEGKSLDEYEDYELIIDFMALCVKARIKDLNDKTACVHAINHFLFHEIGYRFPPFSQHSEKIDTYTLLPSVLDNRQGVCLGVSLLYYSIAQRLGLDLTIYTPPGHIFLSLHERLNIEPTARGIHIPLKSYLSLHIKEIKKRNAWTCSF